VAFILGFLLNCRGGARTGDGSVRCSASLFCGVSRRARRDWIGDLGGWLLFANRLLESWRGVRGDGVRSLEIRLGGNGLEMGERKGEAEARWVVYRERPVLLN